jgi:hypothetical protein
MTPSPVSQPVAVYQTERPARRLGCSSSGVILAQADQEFLDGHHNFTVCRKPLIS